MMVALMFTRSKKEPSWAGKRTIVLTELLFCQQNWQWRWFQCQCGLFST